MLSTDAAKGDYRLSQELQYSRHQSDDNFDSPADLTGRDVCHLDRSILINHQVVWFDVGMNDPIFMGMLETFGWLTETFHRLRHSHRIVILNVVRQVGTSHVFHGEKVGVGGFTGINYRHEIRMRQPCRRLHFSFESCDLVLRIRQGLWLLGKFGADSFDAPAQIVEQVIYFGWQGRFLH